MQERVAYSLERSKADRVERQDKKQDNERKGCVGNDGNKECINIFLPLLQ